ncbi:MAG: sigma-70 family RNA polymerase sigma factor [Deltaproteobacteria bacterium]
MFEFFEWHRRCNEAGLETNSMQNQEHYNEEILPCVPALSRTALRLTRGTALADDLVQETLARAWQARASFRPGTNARAWTHRILFNTYINHYRKKKREREALEELRRTRHVSDRDAHDGFGDEVAAALQGLRPEFREAVELVDLRDLSYQDAADQLACPVGTVMSRLHRGRKRLRRALEGYALDQGVLRPAA